jgi:hypothetical protein
MDYKIEIRTIKDLLDDKKYLTNINMQRKYIYDNKQATYLLDSIQKKIPIPAIYLWDNKNGTFNVLDGKQRITVMRIKHNPKYLGNAINFFIDFMNDNDFYSYEIPVIVCTGTEQDKIETFYRINTTAIKLTEFEIMNALYQGVFVEEFGNWGDNVSADESKLFGSDKRGNNCIKALELFAKDTREYFNHNRNVSFVNSLKKQIEWIVATTISIFGNYEQDLYTFAKIVLENSNDIVKIKSWELNKQKICDILKEHTNNGDIQNAPSKESFYNEVLGCYMVNGLDSTRFFTKGDKQILYSALINGNSKGKKLCSKCNKEFTFDELEIDHILAWSKGGRTELKNAQLLCKKCNTTKGAR